MPYELVDANGLVFAEVDSIPVYSAETKQWQTDIGFVMDENSVLTVKLVQGDTAYALLTPMQFYLSFTTSERMLLKALATYGVPVGSALVTPAPTVTIPADPIIEEFWATYQMAVDAKANVDPNLPSIQEALEYLANPTAPTPAVIAADRISQILAGIAQ